MKTTKLFLGMLAIASMVFVTSCSKDDANVPSSDVVNATFTIGAADMGTRANIGKGLTTDVVACAIFDKNGEEMTALRQTRPVENGKATYNVRLAKGQDYRAVFFAYNQSADAYDVTRMESIEVKNNGQLSNVEARDAFTGTQMIKGEELTESNVEKTVFLKRPFAQLNLGIDATELADAANAGVIVKQSAIKVSNVYNRFNAYDNDIADDATLGSIEFGMNTVPNETLEVNGQQYTYLALNYILVGDTGVENSLTDIEFKWATADGKTNSTTPTHFVNIPVQRNYRTNIIGKLLTSPAEFNIEIDANFDGNKVEKVETVINKTVMSAAALQTEIDNAPVGQTRIVLGDQISGDIVVKQKRDVQILIDGDGKMFVGTIKVEGASNWGGTEGLSIQNTKLACAKTGEANIVTLGYNDATRYAHNIIITNCSFVNFNTYDPNTKMVGIKAYQPNDVTINNCKFEKLHSVAQITGGDNIQFEKVSTANCVRGIALGTVNNALVSNCNIKAVGDGKYGVRQDAAYAESGLKIVESTIEASFPVVVRLNPTSVVNKYALTFEGTNTLTPAAGAHHVAIAKEEYDAVGMSLTPLCSEVTTPGADASWSIFK